MSTLSDLTNRKFEKTGFGGYKIADVDSFMVEMASAYAQADRETNELKRKLETAEKKIQNHEKEEDSLKSTLLNAQWLADKIVSEAQEKADLIIQDAKNKADVLTRNAKIKADNIVGCAQSEIDMRKSEASRIKHEVSEFKLSVMRLYKAQLELINQIPAQSPPAVDEAPVQTEPETEVINSDSKSPEQDVIEAPQNPIEQTFEEAGAAAVTDVADAAVTAASGQDDAKQEPQETQKTQSSQPDETAPAEDKHEGNKDEKMKTVRLNLRYNEKTGEYEPLGMQQDSGNTADKVEQQGKNGDGIRFGADYNIRTDSFNGGTGRHGLWRK